jgi:2-dehydropantoate 2-reductase
VVGAGGVGGYFGGRLLAAGRDVRFLVRPARAAALARTGLVLKSPHGDLTIPSPPTVTADALHEPVDLVLLSCKAYDLASAIDAFAPAVGPETAILPLLNGMAHLDALDARFGAARVLGGECKISAVLDAEGHVLHLNRVHRLAFGERAGGSSARTSAISAQMTDAGFDFACSEQILQEMWEKWAFIATGAGATCLLRATIGDIVAAGAQEVVHALTDECTAIAARNEHRPSDDAIERTRAMFTLAGSPLTASMFRDIESNGRIEGDHIIGDLLARGGDPAAYPLLRVVYAHLRTYDARRVREAAPAA